MGNSHKVHDKSHGSVITDTATEKQEQTPYDENVSSILIINGSHTIKAGWAAGCQPRGVFPSAIGVNVAGTFVIGDEATKFRKTLKSYEFVFPHGLMYNEDYAKVLWRSTFYDELRVAPEDAPVFMSERVGTPKYLRERTMEIMFEEFEVPGYYVACDPLYSLIASGRTTGMSVDLGHCHSSIVPILNNTVCNSAIEYTEDLCGANVSKNLLEMITRGVFAPETTALMFTQVDDIKEKCCKVYHETITDKNIENLPKTSFELPDGQFVSLQSEAYLPTEIYFQNQSRSTSHSTTGTNGLPNMILEAILQTNGDQRRDMLKSIVLTGGSSMFHGMQSRLESEIKTLMPSRDDIMVIANPERKYSAWIGSSILASLSGWVKGTITKQMYEENGSKILERICPGTWSAKFLMCRTETKNQIQHLYSDHKLKDITFHFE